MQIYHTYTRRDAKKMESPSVWKKFDSTGERCSKGRGNFCDEEGLGEGEDWGNKKGEHGAYFVSLLERSQRWTDGKSKEFCSCEKD